MATQSYKSWSVLAASATAFTARFMARMMMFGIVWVFLMWMCFTEVRSLGAEHGRKNSELTQFI